MIQNILDHPNIHVLLNTDFKDIQGKINCSHVYYSGPIDEYYEYRYGKLPYRSVTFKFEKLPCKFYQSAAVVNYPNNYDYTRITEFKHFYKSQLKNTRNTIIAKEIPGAEGDPSYPIPTINNRELYQRYESIPNDATTFIGRLGKYRYYSMDQIVEESLKMDLQ